MQHSSEPDQQKLSVLACSIECILAVPSSFRSYQFGFALCVQVDRPCNSQNVWMPPVLLAQACCLHVVSIVESSYVAPPIVDSVQILLT